MATISPYLQLNGNCEEAFNFYKDVFGGEFSEFNRFSEMPEGACPPGNADEADKIMHIGLPISDECTLMGCDAHSSMGPKAEFGTSVTLSIDVDDKAEVDRIFGALADGGNVQMPCNETFWGSYFGMLTDKFGFHWDGQLRIGRQRRRVKLTPVAQGF